jgi:hypothetical protein
LPKHYWTRTWCLVQHWRRNANLMTSIPPAPTATLSIYPLIPYWCSLPMPIFFARDNLWN